MRGRRQLTLPDDLWRDLRARAFEEGVTASALATALLSHGLQLLIAARLPPGTPMPPGPPETQAARLTDMRLVEVSLVADTPGNRAAGSQGPVTVTPGSVAAAGRKERGAKPRTAAVETRHGTTIHTLPGPEGPIEVETFGRPRPAPKPGKKP